MEKETLGSAIKRVRKSKGISLRELSRRVGISHPYLSQLENDHNDSPSSTFLVKLSKELGIPFSYLIHLSGTDIGLKKELPDNLLSVLSKLDVKDFQKINTWENFKAMHSHSNEPNDEEKIQVSEESLKKIFDFLTNIKKIENQISTISSLDNLTKELSAREWDVDKNKKIEIKFLVDGSEEINDDELNISFINDFSEEEAKERFLQLENIFTMEENIYINNRALTKKEKLNALKLLKSLFDESENENPPEEHY